MTKIEVMYIDRDNQYNIRTFISDSIELVKRTVIESERPLKIVSVQSKTLSEQFAIQHLD